MKCYYLLILLPFLTPVVAHGQTDQDTGPAYDFKQGQQALIFSDTANVRAVADPAGAVTDRLYHGTTVKIEKTGAVYELNGKSAPWCTVSYRLNGVTKTGIIWSGLFAPRVLRKGDVQFLYGMKYAASDTLKTFVELKAMRHDSVIARSSFQMGSIDAARGAHSAGVRSAKGLSGFECLLYFYYSGEACAIPTYEQYMGWDGSQFTRFPQLESSADAGIYVDDQRFIFPADKGGVKDALLLKERIEQSDDNGKPVKTSTTIKKYRLDRTAHKFIKQ